MPRIKNVTRKNLSSDQIKCVELLLTTRRNSDVCNQLGISLMTLNRWFHEPIFQNAVRQAESAALQQIGRNFIALADKATDTLEDALDPSNKLNHRLLAADIITDRLIKLRDAIEIEKRLEDLEKRLNDVSQLPIPYSED